MSYDNFLWKTLKNETFLFYFFKAKTENAGQLPCFFLADFRNLYFVTRPIRINESNIQIDERWEQMEKTTVPSNFNPHHIQNTFILTIKKTTKDQQSFLELLSELLKTKRWEVKAEKNTHKDLHSLFIK